jgi:hypothetical protein
MDSRRQIVAIKLDFEFVDGKAQANTVAFEKSLLRDPVAEESARLQRRGRGFDRGKLGAREVAPRDGKRLNTRPSLTAISARPWE